MMKTSCTNFGTILSGLFICITSYGQQTDRLIPNVISPAPEPAGYGSETTLMSMKHDIFAIKTNYFNRPWPWVKRGIIFCIVLLLLLLKYFGSADDAIGYLLVAIAFFIIFSIPVDEMALDSKYIFYVKKSIMPFFTTRKKYELSKINSISCSGSFSSENDLLAFLSFGQLYQSVNSITISFKDKSNVDFKVAIYKEDLNQIILKVNESLVKTT